jgi:hypothetical protein
LKLTGFASKYWLAVIRLGWTVVPRRVGIIQTGRRGLGLHTRLEHDANVLLTLLRKVALGCLDEGLAEIDDVIDYYAPGRNAGILRETMMWNFDVYGGYRCALRLCRLQ